MESAPRALLRVALCFQVHAYCAVTDRCGVLCAHAFLSELAPPLLSAGGTRVNLGISAN